MSSIQNWANNLLNNGAKAGGVSALKKSAKAKAKGSNTERDAVLTQLETNGKSTVEYTTLNGEITTLIVSTVDSNGKRITQGDNSKLVTVRALNRDNGGIRSLFIDSIRNITAGDVKTPPAQPALPQPFTLTISQQTAIFFWISNTVHKQLVAQGKPKTVSISIVTNALGEATSVVETQTGLTLDI